ncbi:hypothetical protein NDU88_005057, partial [Pleurodeles waltl]
CSAAFLFLAIFSLVLRLQSCQCFLHSMTVLLTSATLLILSTICCHIASLLLIGNFEVT